MLKWSWNKVEATTQDREYRIRKWYDEDARRLLFRAQFNDGKGWVNLSFDSFGYVQEAMRQIKRDYVHQQNMKNIETEYIPIDVTKLKNVKDTSHRAPYYPLGIIPLDNDE